MKKRLAIVALLFLVCFAYSQTKVINSYKIVNKISLDGNDRWDYIFSDDSSGRLYVSHGSQVQIIDEQSGKIIGKINDLEGVHGITIDNVLNKGFISTRNDNSVTVFDSKTLEVIKKIAVSGTNPDAIMYDSFSNKVFVGNGHSNNMSVIDPVSNEETATIKLAGNPEFIVSDGAGHIYVNIESASSIAQINAKTNQVENIWPISPGEEPSGLAIDTENNQLFSVCGNKLMVIVDTKKGKIISTLPIGEGVDGAAFDPKMKCAYSSNGDGTLTIVKVNNAGKCVVKETVTTQRGARTIAVNKLTHHIYLPTAGFEEAVAGQRPKLKPDSFVILEIALK